MRDIFPDYCDVTIYLFLWALFLVSLFQRYFYWNLSPKNYPPISYKIKFLAILYKKLQSLENFQVITSEECARTRSEKHQKQNVCTAMYGLLKSWEKNSPQRSFRKDFICSKSKTLQNDCWHSTERKGGKCIKGVQQQVLQVQVATFHIKSRKNR